jgi:hypothetical protein
MSRPPASDSVSRSYHGFLTGARTGEDGLTYKETVFRAVPSTLSHQPPRAPWELVIADPRPSGTGGAHSLHFLARRVLNTHIAAVTAEVLRCTPWDPFGRQLWADAVATRADSFAVWCAFITAYKGRIPERDYRLPEDERLPPLIKALNGSWLVKLRLVVSDSTAPDLGQLPQLRNLRGLYVTGRGEGGSVDDGLVRTWSRAAAHGGAWHALEVLSLRGFPGVTEMSLREYVHSFPKLRWLDLSRCHWSVQNTAGSGWVQVGWEMWKEMRRRAKGGERPSVVKVVLGAYRKPSGRAQEMRFVRVGEEDKKRKPPPPPPKETKIMPPVVRRKRFKDMGDLLAEFQNPPKKMPKKS